MTSKITTIHDALLELLETTLPDHVRISNPYDLNDNADIELEKGFGIKFGEASSQQRLTCNLDEDRTMSVVLSKRMDSLRTDEERKADVAIELMEEAMTVKRALSGNVLQTAGAAKLNFQGDSGIQENIRGQDSKHFIDIEITFEITYFETFT